MALHFKVNSCWTRYPKREHINQFNTQFPSKCKTSPLPPPPNYFLPVYLFICLFHHPSMSSSVAPLSNSFCFHRCSMVDQTRITIIHSMCPNYLSQHANWFQSEHYSELCIFFLSYWPITAVQLKFTSCFTFIYQHELQSRLLESGVWSAP